MQTIYYWYSSTHAILWVLLMISAALIVNAIFATMAYTNLDIFVSTVAKKRKTMLVCNIASIILGLLGFIIALVVLIGRK